MNGERGRILEIQKKELVTYIPNERDVKLAAKISRWTKQYGHMLPKEPHEILDYFEQGNAVMIGLPNGILVSHAAITQSYPGNWHEIGTVVTDITHRRLRAGTEAVHEIIGAKHAKDPDAKLFALANSSSAPLFEKMGGKKMLSTELPQKVWKPCIDCPNFKLPKQGDIFVCCDTPYDLTGINGFKK